MRKMHVISNIDLNINDYSKLRCGNKIINRQYEICKMH